MRFAPLFSSFLRLFSISIMNDMNTVYKWCWIWLGGSSGRREAFGLYNNNNSYKLQHVNKQQLDADDVDTNVFVCAHVFAVGGISHQEHLTVCWAQTQSRFSKQPFT